MKGAPFFSSILLVTLSAIALGQTIQKGDFSADTSSEGWSLGSGNGPRTHIVFVTFEKPFETVPTVMVTLTGYDASVAKDGAVRLTLKTEKVSREGFVIKVQTWADCHVGAVNGSWMAWASK